MRENLFEDGVGHTALGDLAFYPDRVLRTEHQVKDIVGSSTMMFMPTMSAGVSSAEPYRSRPRRERNSPTASSANKRRPRRYAINAVDAVNRRPGEVATSSATQEGSPPGPFLGNVSLAQLLRL
jgi:hypothetical protein